MKLVSSCFVPSVLSLLVLCAYCSATPTPVVGSGRTNSTASPKAIKDLSLTAKEKRILEQFKANVKTSLENQPERFRDDVYLIRWLRATGFDVKKAEKKLLENFQWRAKHRMDQIFDEDWSDFSSEYPLAIKSYDKHKQPIVVNQMGKWDFRKVLLSGKKDRMLRYIYKMFEGLDQEIYKQQKKGFPVTRSVEIADLAGFAAKTHGCLQCVPLYLEMVKGLDAAYPALFDKIVLINAPGVFETTLNAIKPAMAPETRNSIFVFGTNTKRWRSFLSTLVDDDELPLEFGGKKVLFEHNGI